MKQRALWEPEQTGKGSRKPKLWKDEVQGEGDLGRREDNADAIAIRRGVEVSSYVGRWACKFEPGKLQRHIGQIRYDEFGAPVIQILRLVANYNVPL